MNRKISFYLICILFILVLNLKDSVCQVISTSDDGRVPIKGFFERADLMHVGVFYYPEQWPKEQWKRDLTNIANLGFEFTHFAEFAWTLLEPKEGIYDFKWLDEAVDIASNAGLKIILCTPTLAPPAWMGDKYPEIYLVGADGRRREHGIRANASLSNPIYKSFVEKIVTQLAIHYQNDNRIWGWQIDNEPLATPDYSTSAKVEFQNWLKLRYKNIDSLNYVWGGSFWSTRYDSFDQIVIPNAEMNQEDKLSPHALLDFQRFTADVTADFINNQSDILRRYVIADQWITTNYVNAVQGADPRRSDHLDFPCFTMYPVSGRNILGGNNFRTGNPYRIMEACDYFRPIDGVTGVMELQPGQVNWAPINPQLQPGTVYMWLMQAFGGGCSFACTYRYRHPIWGSEMYHDGIVGTDGVTLSQGGKEFVKAIQSIKELRSLYNPEAKMPDRLTRRKTAFLWSHEAMWSLDIQPQTTQWNTWKFRNTYSSAVKSTGAPMDFIDEKDDFSKYPFMVAPAYQQVDQTLIQRWINYVSKGGHLILTCRTGQYDRNSHFFEAPLAKPILNLIGADVDFFDMLPESIMAKIRYMDKEYNWNCWGEVLSPRKGTEVLATYSDQFYEGKAAATFRQLGKGTVTFIGVNTVDGALERELVRMVYKRAGIQIEDLPRGVYLEWRNGFMVGVNYTDNEFEINIPYGKKLIIGENPLKPTGVIVWQE